MATPKKAGRSIRGVSASVSIRRCLRSFRPALAALALLLPAQALLAQTTVAEPEAASSSIVPLVENGKRIYTADQFTRFAPQTAADIVD